MYSSQYSLFCRVYGLDVKSPMTHRFFAESSYSDCGPLGSNGAALCSDSAAPGPEARIPAPTAHYLVRRDELLSCAKVFRGFGYIAAAVAMEARAVGLQRTQ